MIVENLNIVNNSLVFNFSKWLMFKLLLSMTAFMMCYAASAADAPSGDVTQVDKTEKVTITWAVNPAPPFHIFEGKYASQGIGDVMLNSIIAHMPEAKHTIVRMPHSRISKRVDADTVSYTHLTLPTICSV